MLEHSELAKADAMFTQGRTGLLVQRLDLFGDVAARDDAELFAHPVGKALGQPGQRLVAHQRQQGFKGSGNLAVDKMLQTALHFGNDLGASFFVHKGNNRGLHRL